MDMMKITVFSIMMILLCACSSEEELDGGQENGADKTETVVEDGIVDFDILDAYMSGTSDMIFDRDDMKWYRKDAFTNGEWESFDWMSYIGLDLNRRLPSYFVIHNGQIWEPCGINNGYFGDGPHLLSLPMSAYEAVTGKKVSFYIKRDFDVDREAGRADLIVWEYYASSIVHLDSESFVISRESEYSGGRTDSGGFTKGVASYKISENPMTLNPDVDFGFMDEWELCEWCIALLRDTFGDEIDMTEIPGIAYGNEPIIDIDRLELELMHVCGKITD